MINDILGIILWVFVVISMTLVGYILLIVYYILKPPKNNPKSYLKKIRKINADKKKVIAMVGDSITHGTVSADYTKRIKKALSRYNTEIINAGLNSDTTFNILRRIKDINNCQPDIITILIGTNNALGIFHPDNRRSYIKLKENPEDPEFWTIQSFKNQLIEITTRFKTETNAKIVLLSIPIIGESPLEDAFRCSTKLSELIKFVAEEMEVDYLSINEEFVDYLKKHNSEQNRTYLDSVGLLYVSCFKHYFGFSWNKVAKSHGFQLLTDAVHLNEVGAKIIADSIISYLKKNLGT